MIFQCAGVPSHGRGRRFNPYNAHHFLPTISVVSGEALSALDTQRYGTQPEHDASIRVKSVPDVRALFPRLSRTEGGR